MISEQFLTYVIVFDFILCLGITSSNTGNHKKTSKTIAHKSTMLKYCLILYARPRLKPFYCSS